MSDIILIDEEALKSASDELSGISQEMQQLKKDLLSLLDDLKTGFDTPAGRKFYNSCNTGLLTPIDQQAKVMAHIAENLELAKNMYQSVFDEYREIVKYLDE